METIITVAGQTVLYGCGILLGLVAIVFIIFFWDYIQRYFHRVWIKDTRNHAALFLSVAWTIAPTAAVVWAIWYYW